MQDWETEALQRYAAEETAAHIAEAMGKPKSTVESCFGRWKKLGVVQGSYRERGGVRVDWDLFETIKAKGYVPRALQVAPTVAGGEAGDATTVASGGGGLATPEASAVAGSAALVAPPTATSGTSVAPHEATDEAQLLRGPWSTAATSGTPVAFTPAEVETLRLLIRQAQARQQAPSDLRSGDTVASHWRMDRGLLAGLRAVCDRDGVPLVEALNRAVEAYLRDHP